MGTKGRFVFEAFIFSLVCTAKFRWTLPLNKETRKT